MPSDAKSQRVRFRCGAETVDSQMDARFEDRTLPKARKTFRAAFEGTTGGALMPGAQLAVVVNSVTVGTITLAQEVVGEVEGQLRFDSKGHFGKKVGPFPVTFPVIAAGSTVELQLAGTTVLGCTFN
jgi:hypothetical protein